MKQYSRFGAVLLFGLAQFFVAILCFGDSSLSAAGAGGTAATDAAPTYVRISRAFFEKPLRAQIKLNSPSASGSESKTYGSPVEWIQYPPTAPAPQQNDSEL